jgi:D-sedoheptulose 7-phosphate isomerase
MVFQRSLEDSANLKQKIADSSDLSVLPKIGQIIIDSIINGGKLLICGNGGSAADAQHLAAELLVRLRPTYNRDSIPAISLCQDISTITACGNDFGYEYLFERNLRGLGRKGDVLLGITTSGNSENVNLAFKAAKDMGIVSIGFLGSEGGAALSLCDESFLVPSNETGRIQEVHITIGHALMEFIEDGLLAKEHIRLI